MCVSCSQASENLEDQKDDSLERDSKQALPQQSRLSSLPQGTSLEGTPGTAASPDYSHRGKEHPSQCTHLSTIPSP